MSFLETLSEQTQSTPESRGLDVLRLRLAEVVAGMRFEFPADADMAPFEAQALALGGIGAAMFTQRDTVPVDPAPAAPVAGEAPAAPAAEETPAPVEAATQVTAPAPAAEESAPVDPVAASTEPAPSDPAPAATEEAPSAETGTKKKLKVG